MSWATDLNHTLRDGMTLFGKLIWEGSINADAARELITHHGANIHTRDVHGNFPLMYAVLRRNHALIDALLENGGIAQINLLQQTRQDGRSLLHIAAHNGDVVLVLKLIQLGAFIDHKDAQGRTALYDAVHMLRPDTIALLIKEGASTFNIGEGQDETLVTRCKQRIQERPDLAIEAAETLEILTAYGADSNKTPLQRKPRGLQNEQ